MTSISVKNYFVITSVMIFNLHFVKSLFVTASKSKFVINEGETAHIEWTVETEEVILTALCSINHNLFTDNEFRKRVDVVPASKYSRYTPARTTTHQYDLQGFLISIKNASISQDDNQVFRFTVVTTIGDRKISEVHLSVKKASNVSSDEYLQFHISKGVLVMIIGGVTAGMIFLLIIFSVIIYKHKLLCFCEREQRFKQDCVGGFSEIRNHQHSPLFTSQRK